MSGRSGQIEGLLKQPGDSKGHAGRGGRLALADCVNTLEDLGLVFLMTMTQYRAHIHM